MGIQLVDDNDPPGVGVSVDRRRDMLCEVLLGSGLADAGRDDSARGDIEVGDEAPGSVPHVLELDTLALKNGPPAHRSTSPETQTIACDELVRKAARTKPRHSERRRVLSSTPRGATLVIEANERICGSAPTCGGCQSHGARFSCRTGSALESATDAGSSHRSGWSET